MEALVLALLLLAAVLVSSVIDQLVPKISSPLIQIGLGLLIGLFVPSQISITLDPDLFLVLFIAPLLYDEAKNVDKTALWHNRRPVLFAIGLVIVTALIIGFAVHWIEPSITLFAASHSALRSARPMPWPSLPYRRTRAFPRATRAFSKESHSSTMRRASCRSSSPSLPQPRARSRSWRHRSTSPSASSAASSSAWRWDAWATSS